MRFLIEGHPLGYYSTTYRGKFVDPRAKKYAVWKTVVQGHALASGVKIPLIATPTSPVLIVTRATFKGGVHSDPENVHKGIVDALFERSPGGDKHVAGMFASPMYGDPQVEIIIADFFGYSISRQHSAVIKNGLFEIIETELSDKTVRMMMGKG